MLVQAVRVRNGLSLHDPLILVSLCKAGACPSEGLPPLLVAAAPPDSGNTNNNNNNNSNNNNNNRNNNGMCRLGPMLPFWRELRDALCFVGVGGKQTGRTVRCACMDGLVSA